MQTNQLTMPQEVKDKTVGSPPFVGNVRDCLEALANSLRPPKNITISQWSSENRVLPPESSASPGKWTNDRTPYLVEIMDKLSPQDSCADVAFVKGTQIGGTECIINTALYYMKQSPCPIGIFQSTDDSALDFERQRLNSTFQAMGLGEYFTNESEGCKEFPGGILFIGSAGSSTELRAKPLMVVLCDEISEWKDNLNGQGDPTDLVKKRTTNFPRKKRFWNSSPTILGKCKITKKYLAGDQRHYEVPCPHCGVLHRWEWRNMVWDRDADGNHLAYTARMKCPHCGYEYQEWRKTELLRLGQWVPNNPNGAYPSYRLPAFYSPLGWFSWQEAVEEFLDAQGDVEKLKAWTNNVCAEAWDPEREVKQVHSDLILRLEDYGCEVPDGVLILTVGVDTQDDRLEVEIVGWGRGLESWSIGYWILYGDPDLDEVWADLDALIEVPYKKANGQQLYVAAGLVDSGGHKTSAVYHYCAAREWRHIYASIGARGPNKPVISRPGATKMSSAENAKLITVGTDTIKDWFFNVVDFEKPGPGYCHFPKQEIYNDEHFRQLVNSEVKKGHMSRGFMVYSYEKVYARNEPLDCRVYNRAALNLTGVNVDKLADAGVSYTRNPMQRTVRRNARTINSGVRL